MEKNKGSGFLLLIIIIALMLGMLSMCTGGSGSKGDRTCAWCNGTGYSGNGATTATEYVMRKTPCKHCGGTGHY